MHTKQNWFTVTVISLILLTTITACEHDEGEVAWVCTSAGSCGTVWAVTPTQWIGAAHVWHDDQNVTATLIHNELGELPVYIDKFVPDKDLVLFSTEPGLEFDDWTLCDAIPPCGSRVTALSIATWFGIPDQAMGSVVAPVMHNKALPDADLLYLDISVFGGFSGGPVIYNRNNCIVGSMYGSMKYGKAFAVNVHEIKKVLK